MTTISDYYELHSTDGLTKVTFSDCGEGYWGDYNPDDPDDVGLLRFDVYYRQPDGWWEPANDASYCTQVPIETEPATVERLLAVILTEVHGKVDAHGGGVKKVCERLSWMDSTWA